MSEFDDYENEENYQQFKQDMSSQMQHMKRYHQETAHQNAANDQAAIFNDALKEAGLDQTSFNQLVALNPEGTRESFVEHVKSYVGNVARKRDKKTGQFVPGKPQAQPQGHVPEVQPRDLTEQDRANKMADLKARANKGESIDEEDVISTLFPDPLY